MRLFFEAAFVVLLKNQRNILSVSLNISLFKAHHSFVNVILNYSLRKWFSIGQSINLLIMHVFYEWLLFLK